MNLSASSIKDFMSCSYRYHLRKVYPQESIQTPEMLTGTLIHKAIDEYWDKDYETALGGIETTEENKEQIMICLRNFYNSFSVLLSKNDESERWFDIPYSKGIKIVGRIDRITQDGVLIDWKTGRSTPKNIDGDIQFILYNYVYKKIYNKSPNKILYISLLYNKMLPFTYYETRENTLIENIIPTMLKRIKQNLYAKEGMYNGQCYNCPWVQLCW